MKVKLHVLIEPLQAVTGVTNAIPYGEKWLPFVSGIEHAPFHLRNRVAGIMSELAYFYVFIT